MEDNYLNCSLPERNKLLNLNGTWHFRTDPQEIGERRDWHAGGQVRDREVVVPSPWQLQSEDLLNYSGSAWYERDLYVPAESRDERLVLVFEAVDYLSKVWVNGEYVGEHEGGFLPFKFDITSSIRFGEANTVTVRVKDFDGSEQDHIPSGYQIWGQQISGIWQNVWIETHGETFFTDIFAVPDVDQATAEIRIEVSSIRKRKTACQLQIEVRAPTAETFNQQGDIGISPGAVSRESFLFRFENPVLWDLDTPELYEVTARVVDREGSAVDSVSIDFGMRKVEARNNYICLNDRPVYLIGALDPPYPPDKNMYRPEYSFLTDEDIRLEIERAKELGVNMLRKIVKCEYPRYLYWADRMGMLIWEEPPFILKFSDESTRRWQKTMEGMVIRDRNHPSIFMWGMFNENVGIPDILTSVEQQAFVKKMYDRTRELDPTRLIMDDSNGFCRESGFWDESPELHVKTDVHDFHFYLTVPAQYRDFKEKIAGVKAHDKPVLASEFGLMDMANLDKIKQRHRGKTGWWLNTEMRHGITKGYEERFHRWELDKLYGDFTGLADSHDWHNFEGLKCMIEGTRLNGDISGYCITALCDDFFQPFGLLDFFREPKVFHQAMAQIQGPDLLIVDWTKLNFYSEETFDAPVSLSHLSRDVLENCTLEWSLADSDLGGRVEGIRIDGIGPTEIARIRFNVPEVAQSRTSRLTLSLETAGRTVNENYVDICLFPDTLKTLSGAEEVNVYDPEARLVEHLRRKGTRAHEGLNPDNGVAVATALDEQVKAYVENGGSALVLLEETFVDDELGLAVGEPLFFVDDPFYFLDKSLFPEIPYDNPLKWPFYKLFPGRDIANLGRIPPADLLSGCFGPFIRVDIRVSPEDQPEDRNQRLKDEVAAAIAKFNFGRGKLVISTFKLIEAYGGDDPVATIMLHNLLRYVAAGFDAQTSLPLGSGEDRVHSTQKRDNF